MNERLHDKRTLFCTAQDVIDKKREQLISEIEGKMKQRAHLTSLFEIKWRIE